LQLDNDFLWPEALMPRGLFKNVPASLGFLEKSLRLAQDIAALALRPGFITVTRAPHDSYVPDNRLIGPKMTRSK
jgi:hypothetical protein